MVLHPRSVRTLAELGATVFAGSQTVEVEQGDPGSQHQAEVN